MSVDFFSDSIFIITVSSVLPSAALGILIFARGKRGTNTIAFFVASLAISFWAIANYFSLSTDIDVLFWIRQVMFTAVFLVYSFFIFVKSFGTERIRLSPFWLVVLSVLTLGTMIAAETPLLFSSLTYVGNQPVPQPGPLIPLFSFTVLLLFLLSTIELVTKVINSKEEKKIQFIYIASGYFLMFALLILTQFVLTVLFDNTSLIKFGPLFTLPFLFLTTYAILRHHLFEIKVIATELFTAVIFLVFLANVFSSKKTTELVLNIALLGFIVVFGVLLIRSVISEVRRREETEQINKSLKALQAITRRITESLDFTEVTQEVVDAVKNKLGYIGAVVLTLDVDRKTVKAQTITQSSIVSKALKKLPKPLKEISGKITDENLVNDVIRKDSVALSDDLSDFTNPVIDPVSARFAQKMLGMESMVGVPISIEGKVNGALLFALRKPSLQIKPQEIETMKALGDQLGIINRNIGIIQELKRLDKAKSEFVSIASHQLRTPITAAKGYISMIMEGDYGRLPKNIAKPLDIVLKNNDRLIELINNLLNLSRIEGGRFIYEWTEVDLRDLINDVAAIITPQAKAKGLSVIVSLPDQPALIRADKEKMRQLVMNITDNSVKYTNKGSINLTLRKDPKAKTLIYTVKDTGIGIAASDLPFLFQKFTRGTGSSVMHTQGTGLGLYVAKKVAEEHKAKVWAESPGEGKGSTFTLEIPYLTRRKKLAKPIDRA
jgi:signal transduction histidine kinase